MMAISIPLDFDVNLINLDPLESRIRDEFRLEIGNWIKFRHTINIGTNAEVLSSPILPIANEVKQAYLEIGKSHYEVVTSLGNARLSLDLATQAHPGDHLLFKKSYKDFYFHNGCLLDNLARLIYIVVDPQGATAKYLAAKGRKLRRGHFIRHWIDWGELPLYPGYQRLKKSQQLAEIINIRNVFTHGWMCPIYRNQNNGTLSWPIAIRTRRNFYWPHGEQASMRKMYRKKMPILDMMQGDLTFIESFQVKVFDKLVRDIEKFERHNNVLIN
jgi:hypothetical protein